MAKKDHSKTTPPAFAKFFADALPNDGGNHTLCVGEAHNDTAHLDLLSTQLESLQKNNNVQTLGLEQQIFFNVFIWAYRDGLLTKLLGSQESVQNYIKLVFTAGLAKPENIPNGRQKAILVIRALDSGMNVIANDSRFIYSELQKTVLPKLEDYRRQLSDNAKEKGMTVDKLQQEERLYAGAEWRSGLWLLEEIQWLCKERPEYAQKLEVIDDLLRRGQQKINEGKLTYDALSAVLFNAIAEEGNRLTIGGSGHINGMGLVVRGARGTFGQHLFATGQPKDKRRPYKITHAMIATTVVADDYHQDFGIEYYTNPNTRALANHRVSFLNLDDGSANKTLWHPEDDDPNDARIVPLEKKFPVPPGTPPRKIAAITKAHINPLLIPDIKRAADAVREMMNGEDKSIAP